MAFNSQNSTKLDCGSRSGKGVCLSNGESLFEFLLQEMFTFMCEHF